LVIGNAGWPEAEFLDEIQTKVLRVFLLAISTVNSTALPWDLYFFKLTQPLTVSTVHLLYTVKAIEENLIENHTSFLMVEEIHTETSSLRNLKIMPRNLNEIVRL
jgi:hypothetical protein